MSDLDVVGAMLVRAGIVFKTYRTRGSKKARKPEGTVLVVDEGQRVWVDLKFDPEGKLVSLEGDTF